MKKKPSRFVWFCLLHNHILLNPKKIKKCINYACHWFIQMPAEYVPHKLKSDINCRMLLNVEDTVSKRVKKQSSFLHHYIPPKR